ncbi:MAG: DUF2334 domain-containing protein [Candidatus Woesearchaeota archaeon]
MKKISSAPKKITLLKRTLLFVFLLFIITVCSYFIIGCTGISRKTFADEKNGPQYFLNSTIGSEYSNDYLDYNNTMQLYINNIDNYTHNSNNSNNTSNNNLIISFRIDDITFNSNQKKIIENAIYLARKYNITFDLAVIASSFEKNSDPELVHLYENNRDILEIGAHGYTHQNPINKFGKGEFFNLDSNTSIQYDIQEYHIKKMKTVFAQKNIVTGTKIFFVPWHAGDNNTIDIAERYGYEILTQRNLQGNSPSYNTSYNNTFYYYKQIMVTPILIGVKMNETLTESDVLGYMDSIYNVKKRKLQYLEIVFHPVNFYEINSTEKLISQIVANFSSNSRFDFVSVAIKK